MQNKELALSLAISSVPSGTETEAVVTRANLYYQFLSNDAGVGGPIAAAIAENALTPVVTPGLPGILVAGLTDWDGVERRGVDGDNLYDGPERRFFAHVREAKTMDQAHTAAEIERRLSEQEEPAPTRVKGETAFQIPEPKEYEDMPRAMPRFPEHDRTKLPRRG